MWRHSLHWLLNMSSSIKTDACFPKLMEKATHSAILERRKKINKGKHVFRQGLSRSILSQGSIRFAGLCGQYSPAWGDIVEVLCQAALFQQCACLVKLYYVSVLYCWKKDKNIYCWANLVCWRAHHSRLLCIQWKEMGSPGRWFANFALGVWNCSNELCHKKYYLFPLLSLDMNCDVHEQAGACIMHFESSIYTGLK